MVPALARRTFGARLELEDSSRVVLGQRATDVVRHALGLSKRLVTENGGGHESADGELERCGRCRTVGGRILRRVLQAVLREAPKSASPTLRDGGEQTYQTLFVPAEGGEAVLDGESSQVARRLADRDSPVRGVHVVIVLALLPPHNAFGRIVVVIAPLLEEAVIAKFAPVAKSVREWRLLRQRDARDCQLDDQALAELRHAKSAGGR